MPNIRGMHMMHGARGGDPNPPEHRPTPERADGFFSSWETAAATGLSYRMLDYWARVCPGTLGPSVLAKGSGSRRGYTLADVERLKKAAAFYRACGWFGGLGSRRVATGTTGPSVEAVARFVREAEPEEEGWTWGTDDFTLWVREEQERRKS